ncbi:amino acid ABC transporter permease [Grimontia sp. NTOU-MAR1]|uniref:amino acid ABC transporter permease n=1 Tax=Grimontia sp. NTOU-MAR1 TaxID=3111011 RepID=UPI002DBD545D|nr:amino acid ABC transporter permease [Grimontia sp. NTOU-MAR1]WRW00994.1 amino acid ABC transporter permease [Grimontia sp. NTOU-MAR1]
MKIDETKYSQVRRVIFFDGNLNNKRIWNGLRSVSLTVFITAVILYLTFVSGNWLVYESVAPWKEGIECVNSDGACWPFVREKIRLIAFGTYPYQEQWRPLLASLIIMAMILTCMVPKLQTSKLIPFVIICSVVFIILMQGGVFGLEYVQQEKWNGIPVLLLLAVFSLALAFPIGVILGIARYQDKLEVIRVFSIIYIEIIRGVPMVMVLFIGLFIIPLILPKGLEFSPLYTTMTALIFFHSAYFAEVIRGGLQSIPRWQFEAAYSQGLTYHQTMRLIILPQALKNSMPGIMNTILGAYKDTSLVVIIGIHDITATARMAFSDPFWQKYGVEAYLCVALWYIGTCWCLSSYSRWLEKRLINS